MIGLAPLLNLAVIGLLFLVARKLGSPRRERQHNPRPYFLGFTYFCVHFVALGCFTCWMMPSVLESYSDAIRPLTNTLENCWSHFISKERNPRWWMLQECITFGVFISGPPMLLSACGGMLAKRCAPTLPRPRFRAITLLASSGFALAALSVALTPQPFDEYYQKVEIDFQVVDEVSGEPIGTSFVLIKNAIFSWVVPARALTGPDGRAHLSPKVRAFGQRNAFRTMGVFLTSLQWLEVFAPGHRTIRIPLTDVLGPTVDLEDPRPRRVALARGETPEDAFRDVAGVYWDFQIEPDGRYAYHDSGGCFGTSTEHYGYMKRFGEEFIFLPIAQPSEAIDPALAPRFRVLTWGSRHYLCPMNDRTIRAFCRASLRLPYDPDLDSWGRLRHGDPNGPPTGLPQFPWYVWARYALNEWDVFDEDSGLRMAIGSLNPWKS